MSEIKHTPGPWKVGDWSKNKCRFYINGTEGKDEHFMYWEGLAVAYGQKDEPDMGKGKALANANIIAAAPELLEALMDCREYCYMAIKRHEDEYGRHPATEHERKGMVDDLARYDAIIAKATGKSS